VLIYPVISMLDGVTHGGSRYNLLGNSPSKAVIERMSAELRVNKNTPPAFLVHTLDDDAVPAENSIRYAKALVSSGVPAELHLYQSGGHGFGLGKTGTSTAWTIACEAWLKLNGFLPERN
jgi:acetyl esterase/lipase